MAIIVGISANIYDTLYAVEKYPDEIARPEPIKNVNSMYKRSWNKKFGKSEIYKSEGQLLPKG